MRFTSTSLASLTLVTLATVSRASVIEGLVPRVTPTVANDVCGCIDAITISGSKFNLAGTSGFLISIIARLTDTPFQSKSAHA